MKPLNPMGVGASSSGSLINLESSPRLSGQSRSQWSAAALHAKSGALHAKAGAQTLWDSGTACSLISAFVFSVNSLLVKLLGNRVPSTEIVLVRRYVCRLMFGSGNVKCLLTHRILDSAKKCIGVCMADNWCRLLPCHCRSVTSHNAYRLRYFSKFLSLAICDHMMSNPSGTFRGPDDVFFPYNSGTAFPGDPSIG